LVPSNIGPVDTNRRHWSGINEDLRIELLTAIDIQDNLMEGVNRFVTEMDYNLESGQTSINMYSQNIVNLYQLFHSSTFMYDSNTGKFAVKT